MKCPKCGQDLLNINGREICTSCGVQGQGASLAVQIADNIKAKVPAIPAVEEYVSSLDQGPVQAAQPVQVPQPGEETVTDLLAKTQAAQREKEIALKDQASQAVTSDIPDFPDKPEELEVIPRTEETVADLAKNETDASSEEAETEENSEATRSSIPDFPTEEPTTAPIQKNQNTETAASPSSDQAPIAGPVLRANEGEKVIPITEEFTSEIREKNSVNAEIQQLSNQIKDESSKLNIEPFESGFPVGGEQAKTSYPSHQLSPQFIKLLIIVLAVILVFGTIGYVYLNFESVARIVNRIVVFVGESFFQ